MYERSAAAGGADNRNCFVAGTMVWLSNGKRVAIQNVRLGEEVLTRNPAVKSATLAARNPLGRGRVLQLYRHLRPTIVLRFSDGEKLTTTAGHRFFEAGVGFVPAGRLAIGCQIITRAGPPLRLEAEHSTGKLQTVYNFEVGGTHTYFVGKAGLWVHNDCKDVARKLKRRIGGDIWKLSPKPETGAPWLQPPSGELPGDWPWAHHYVVVKDDKVWDPMRGKEGVPKDEYLEDWDMEVTDFIPE